MHHLLEHILRTQTLQNFETFWNSNQKNLKNVEAHFQKHIFGWAWACLKNPYIWASTVLNPVRSELQVLYAEMILISICKL